MLGKILLTPVDEIVQYVKNNNGCKVSELGQKFRVPVEIIKKWLVVLEEYNVLKTHYKGLEGYVYITKEASEKEPKESIDVEKLKDTFIEKAKIKRLSYDKIKQIWPVFLEQYKVEIKNTFYEKAKKKGYEPAKIERAWFRFEEELYKI